MRELVPQLEEKTCAISGLPTHYLYNGTPIFLGFLTAANKFCEKYPEKTFDEALEIIVDAKLMEITVGEDNMTPERLREIDNVEPLWKKKIKQIFKR